MFSSGSGASGGSMQGATNDTLVVKSLEPIVPGKAAQLDTSIVDQEGARFTTFDRSTYGRIVCVTVASRDLSFYASISLQPGSISSSWISGLLLGS